MITKLWEQAVCTVELLPAAEQDALAALVLSQVQDHASSQKPGPRRAGTAAGLFRVPDDFDDPLPEDVLADWEGR